MLRDKGQSKLKEEDEDVNGNINVALSRLVGHATSFLFNRVAGYG